ncbi:MAG: DUF262 domain-containing protein [Bacteroidales bacterium]|jgi:uncharacterized protein with ParB-like and HNH nuclease domain|nr:DUF262 domain-containing protein [Bacteroidales bacterium]
MDNRNTTFTSGNEYSLSQIFTGNNKIVIPDLQRDYCWGDKAWDKDKKDHTELVSGFVDNLISSFDEPDKEVTMGLIYGYEQPKHYIQLCDGQQRLTTLFLLLGMLNRKTEKENEFQTYLISDYELNNDDKEPYLQYAIRESTLYFLSDLVCEFFLKKDVDVDKIKEQDWYFAEYDLDASIQSMLAAIKTIECKLSNVNVNDCKRFGKFILTKLKMIYYDMGNRTRGEETFVVINTTGEPLTATENLKPILLGDLQGKDLKKYSEQWEDREEWFWKNRGEKQTADDGHKEFFRWVEYLTKSKESEWKGYKDEEKINLLNVIDRYFNIVERLFDKSDKLCGLNEIKLNDKNEFKPLFVFLPIVQYINRFKDVNERNLLRITTFFYNLSRHKTISADTFEDSSEKVKNPVTFINKLPDEDILSILNIKEEISKEILTSEEERKFEIYKAADHNNADHNREDIENIFWKAEAHPIWKGEILPMIEWATQEDKFNFDSFKEYDKTFCQLFYDNLEYDDLDITRRALLTRNLKEYPKRFRGYTNYSFCWEYSDWKTIITENKTEFGIFLKELIDNNGIGRRNQMIDNNPTDREYDEFVKIPQLLGYCQQKNIQWNEKRGWILIKKERATTKANLKSYRLHLDLNSEKNKFWNNKWQENFREQDKTCVYFDFEEKCIAIDIIYSGNDLYQLQFFNRDNASEDNKTCLKTIAKIFNLDWKGERFVSQRKTREEIIELLKNIMSEVEKF